MLIQVSHQVMSPELIQLIDAMVQALRMGLWMIYQYIWRWCYGLYEIICIHMHIFFINIYIYMHMMIYHVYTYNCVEYNSEQITSRNRCLPFLTDATPKPSNGLFHRFSDGHCPIMVLIVVLNPLLFFWPPPNNHDSWMPTIGFPWAKHASMERPRHRGGDPKIHGFIIQPFQPPQNHQIHEFWRGIVVSFT